MNAFIVLAIVTGLVLFVPPLAAAQDFDHHFLAAACTQITGPDGRVRGQIVVTPDGVAVQHQAAVTRDVVLFCNVDPATVHFFNVFQVIAEDNTPTGSVSATLYRANADGGGPPTALATVTTTDQAGVQVAQNFVAPGIESLNEIFYYYYIVVTVHREQLTDVVRVYAVSLRDVL
jgi:hypothetical protein